MRRAFVFSMLCFCFFSQAVAALGMDQATCALVAQINRFVSEQTMIAFYGGAAEDRQERIAQLKATYAEQLGKLKELATKEKGEVAEVQDALTKFEKNVAKCSECEHQFRHLTIDLVSFLECKSNFCDPMDQARNKIGDLAWKCKHGK